MTYNVHYSNRNAAEIADLIHREQPDIIALQELTGDLAGLLFVSSGLGGMSGAQPFGCLHILLLPQG